jgi:hypothetical protein
MAFMSQDRKAQIEPKVKAVLKKYKVKGRLSVRNHCTLMLTVKSGEIDFIENYYENLGSEHRNDVRPGYIDINVYHFYSYFDGPAYNFLNEVYAAMMDGNWDNSEPQFDHFDRGWHVDINIGKWNNHYVLVK